MTSVYFTFFMGVSCVLLFIIVVLFLNIHISIKVNQQKFEMSVQQDMPCVSAGLTSAPTNSVMEYKQKRKQSTDFRGSKSKYVLEFFESASVNRIKHRVPMYDVSTAFTDHRQKNMLARKCRRKAKCRSKKCGK